MLVDTSVLIELLRNTQSRSHLLLLHAMETGSRIVIPAVVLQEVLQGAKSPLEYLRLERALSAFEFFTPLDDVQLHKNAAMLYARCRWQGLSPRSPHDCVVAACAIEADLPLLANDRDFVSIAQIEPQLKLVT